MIINNGGSQGAAATQGFQHFNTTHKSANLGLGLNVTGMRAGASQANPPMAVIGVGNGTGGGSQLQKASMTGAIPPRNNGKTPSSNIGGNDGGLLISGNSTAIAQHQGVLRTTAASGGHSSSAAGHYNNRQRYVASDSQ